MEPSRRGEGKRPRAAASEIFVNCEVQGSDSPSYPITKRGIYYAARMVSAQRGTVFKGQGYGEIKKCVSIWLCEDAAESRSDTINCYSITEECLRGSFRERRQDYDLITVVVLRLGAKGEQSGDDAIWLLSKMFSKDLKYDEKIASLRDEFHISMTRAVSEEVLDVCNLSTGIFNKGYDSGYDTGYDSGISDKCRDVALSLYDMGDPIEKIAKVSKVGVETVQQWLDERQEGKA